MNTASTTKYQSISRASLVLRWVRICPAMHSLMPGLCSTTQREACTLRSGRRPRSPGLEKSLRVATKSQHSQEDTNKNVFKKIDTEASPCKWKALMLKRTLHTFFREEFFHRSHKLINFLKFILANFWKRENFFLKMMNTVKM